MSTKTFKLIVTISPKSIQLLRYLNKHISQINTLGAKVHIEKLDKDAFDEDMVSALKRKGITRLPALMSPDGKNFIGLKNITELFDRNLQTLRNSSRISADLDPYGGPATGAEMGSNPDMNDFYMRELFNGVDKHGQPIARVDKDEADNEGGDIGDRMRAYERNIPSHRQGNSGRERDIDTGPRQRGRTRDEDDYERPRGRGRGRDDPDDNIEDPENTPIRAPRLPSTGDGGGDAMDRRMMDAWLDNNPGDQ
jgi:hypothetical protein